MNRFFMAAVAVLGLMAPVVVADVTISFDPNDILDKYPTASDASKTTQENARRVHAQWAANYYGTFSDYMQSGHTQPSDYSTYMGWRNSLTDPGEGIAVINTWFLDDGAAGTWGEKVVVKPGTAVTATAVAGWNVNYIVNPYGLGGTAVQFYTTDPSLRLRPTDLGGADIGQFSITADLYYDQTGDGYSADDIAVKQGDSVRFWVGNLNGDDPGFFRSDTQALYYTGGPLGDSVYSNAAGVQGSGFEGVLTVTVVPAPGAIVLGMMGLGLVGWVKRRMA